MVKVPLIQCHKTVDYWFNEERLKIDTSKSTILRVGLKPVRNTVSSNRRLSTEYISFKTLKTCLWSIIVGKNVSFYIRLKQFQFIA
uniref:Uncharacterized protein n=1 Tax=Wuchereria bancrofti TaxID=6293 RepID=A0AAF5PL26_WUCBA